MRDKDKIKVGDKVLFGPHGFKYVVQEVFPYGAKIGEPKEDSFYVCYNEIKKQEDES